MPEGDTVWRTARRLDEALGRQPLTRVDLRWGQAATVDLSGRTTLEVASRGKHLLHRIEDGWTIHSHLRMEGSWRVIAAEQVTQQRLAGRDIRAVVASPAWCCLGVRLGMLDVLPTAREHEVVGHLGPDLLGSDWDESKALANLARDPERPIGAALLDQRNLAGIGTLYAAESLFLQRLHPWSPVGVLSPDEVAALVRRARRLLRANCEHAVQSTTGSRLRGEETYVHARSGRECRRCGDTVRVAMIGLPPQERTMFSCPTCQGGRGPTDDGRPQRPLGSSPGRLGGSPGRSERGTAPRPGGSTYRRKG